MSQEIQTHPLQLLPASRELSSEVRCCRGDGRHPCLVVSGESFVSREKKEVNTNENEETQHTPMTTHSFPFEQKSSRNLAVRPRKHQKETKRSPPSITH